MKKFLSLLLAVIMLLGCIPAVAEEFPKLDNKAAWDYIGDWFGVSGLNVMDEPTTEYPELKLNLYLNGLGDLYLDGGKKEIVGWAVEVKWYSSPVLLTTFLRPIKSLPMLTRMKPVVWW